MRNFLSEIKQSAAQYMVSLFSSPSTNFLHALRRGEPVPDPITLLRRLAAIESAMEKLQVECAYVVENREELVLSVTALQIENVARLKHVSPFPCKPVLL